MPVITILPKSRLRLRDMAEAAAQAGQSLWQNGRAIVACAVKPGPAWHRIGIVYREAA